MEYELLGNLNFHDKENNEEYNFDIEIQDNCFGIFYEGELIETSECLMNIINKNNNINEMAAKNLLNKFEEITNVSFENY